MSRYDMSDFEWSVIQRILPQKSRGVPRVDGVVLLAGRNREADRQAAFVGYSMDFRSKTAPASSETTIRVAFFKVAAE